MGGTKSAPLPGGTTNSTGAASGGAPLPPSFPETAPPPSPGGGMLGDLSSGGLKLSAPVGPGAANIPDDVFRVETVLKDADILDRPPGRAFGDDTAAAIKARQQHLNADSRIDLGASPLKLDGLVNPDGPTQAATRHLAGGVLSKPNPIAAKPAPVATPGGPKRETLEQTVNRVARLPKSYRGQAQAAPKPDLTADDISSLQRLADGAKKSTHPGPIAKDIADAFRAKPDAAAQEFLIVRDALAKGGTPAQVNNLTEDVRAELSPKDRGRFDQLVGPGGEGQKGEKPSEKLPSPIRDIGPPTDTPVDRVQMLEKLGFDPDSKSGERLRAVEAPYSGVKGFLAAEEAKDKMKAEILRGRLPMGNAHDNKADAFRHAYWNYAMTKKIGPDGAKRFGDGHEITDRNKDSERLMDLYNNNVGRRLALDPANRGRQAEEVILEAIQNGKLQTRPFRFK